MNIEVHYMNIEAPYFDIAALSLFLFSVNIHFPILTKSLLHYLYEKRTPSKNGRKISII